MAMAPITPPFRCPQPGRRRVDAQWPLPRAQRRHTLGARPLSCTAHGPSYAPPLSCPPLCACLLHACSMPTPRLLHACSTHALFMSHACGGRRCSAQVTVRKKPGLAKSWALITFRTTEALEVMNGHSAARPCTQPHPCLSLIALHRLTLASPMASFSSLTLASPVAFSTPRNWRSSSPTRTNRSR